MSNIKFQNALQRKAQPVPPIWFMRQAGRYHQHYQALRKQHSFMELCKNPKLAAEVALGPVEEFDFDVSILFSDLLFPLEALGMGLTYDNGPPELGWHLTQDNFSKLSSVDKALPHLEFQKFAVQETRKVLPKDKSLIGFVGGPWTLFVYAVEGSHVGSLIKSKQDFNLYKKFSELIVPLLIKNIQFQFDGGAEVVMIFDTAAGELDPQTYKDIVYPDLAKLAAQHSGKLGYYSKTTQISHLKDTAFTSQNWAGVGVDWRWDIKDAFKNTNKGFVQGNFDQSLLLLKPNDFEKKVMSFLAPIKNLSLQERAGWVCGLGHGVLPATPELNVKNFVKIVREVLS